MDVSPPAEAIDRAGRGAARYIRRMSEVLDIAAIAALVGDPARANMLCALLDGRALTASELAYAAHITPQTASGHLGKLARASLVVPAQQGRHRYYRLAGAHVAAMMESISAVSAIAPPRLKPIRIDDKMREARMCYDHIAGRLGVTLADALRAAAPCRVRRRRRRGDAVRRSVLRPDRHRSRDLAHEPARVLPSLHRLERAARAPRRRGRSRTGEPPDGVALDRPQARHARACDHADRLEQYRAHLRLLAARSHGAGTARVAGGRIAAASDRRRKTPFSVRGSASERQS